MHWVHESSVVALLDVALSRREEPTTLQPPPNAATFVLALDRRGLVAATELPQVSLLEAFLACKELSPKGDDVWAGALCPWSW